MKTFTISFSDLYSPPLFLIAVELAKQSGIDAFAINIGRDITNEKQIPLAYDVADKLDFSLFLSFDMSYYGQPGSSKDVIKLIRTFANRKSQFKYQGKPMVSTFSGEVPGTYLVSVHPTCSSTIS